MEHYEAQGLLHENFRRQAAETPDHVAVVSEGQPDITYKQLDEITDDVATKLRIFEVGLDDVVAIYMEKTTNYVIAYISILKAGGAYLPLDVSYPAPLIADIFDDVKPKAIFVSSKYRHQISDDIPNIIETSSDWLAGIQDSIIDTDEKYRKTDDMTLDNLAYTVYSSGTTGRPKGIQCPHRGAVFSYFYRHVTNPYGDLEREAVNVFFVWEMLRPLLRGVTLYIIPDHVIYDPRALLSYLQANQITRQLFTPSLFEALLELNNEFIKECLKSMRLVIFCGEVVTTSLLARCLHLFPWIQFINLYSVSESHDMTCGDLNQWHKQLKGDINAKKFCPVGKIIDGVEIVVLDEDLQKLPLGISGEIYVGGPTLAKGYLNRDDLNKTRFIYLNNENGIKQRLYKTGDWGYMLSDGSFEICGRCDSMVKIRGYSIEIQAVESVLLDLVEVNSCAVLVLGEEGEDKYLVAYIVPENKETTKKIIRSEIKKRLPFYMIPSYFIFLESIPLLAASGKLDKKVLRNIDLGKSESKVDQDGRPTTEIEIRISEMWRDVLKLKTVDIHETFFDLGGHSLLATKLLNMVNEEFSTCLYVSDLFSNSTVAELSKLLESMASDDEQGKETTGESGVDGSCGGGGGIRSGDSELNLQREVENHDVSTFSMDIQLRSFWRSAYYHKQKWNNGRVLLTGCTGFLGSYILKELLLNTKTHIFCIVRGLPDQSESHRIIQTLEQYNILLGEQCSQTTEHDAVKLRQEFHCRVTAMRGDVGLVNLGLSTVDYHYLCTEIDYVIHSAAYVNLIYPYKALYAPNVLGTQNSVKFCIEGKTKPLHYVSTNAVLPVPGVNYHESKDISELSAKHLKSGYAQTKWVAERLVKKAMEKGLPAVIYRLGNLSGDSSSGNWNVLDFNLMLLQSLAYTGCAPLSHGGSDDDTGSSGSRLEMTPVNWVAEFIIKSGSPTRVQSALGNVYHLINKHPMPLRSLYNNFDQFGYPLERIDYNQWKLRILDSGMPRKEQFVKLLNNLIQSEYFNLQTTLCENENTLKMLKDIGTNYPEVDDKMLKGYLSNLVALKELPKQASRIENIDIVDSDYGALSNKVVFITGASSGIGRAIAIAIAKEGAKVVLAARRLEKLEEVKQEILNNANAAAAASVLVTQCDVTSIEQVDKAVSKTLDLFGHIDILVNNAGVMFYTRMQNRNIKQWNEQIDINCKGVTNCIAAVLPSMMQKKSGHIINMSSDAGKVGFAGLGVYCGTKFFVEGLSRSMRVELVGTGVKITCIQPGDVKTPLIHRSTEQEAITTFSCGKEAEILHANDIADAVIYASSTPATVAVNEVLVQPRNSPIA